ncbi:hypothetical protein Pcinc_001503 [Petrolisthes cinctipes]|uniref:Uncharacterized protein n=1 Tax=Petrolisthes cinctipes TaxID=88211 RepID=A0AAE1GMU3_PETCI|nr:hypothetical protein Pcinc_001503 [Petrolisthes cinctipes]
MTHGRGITDSTLTKWVHALPQYIPLCDALEKFTGVHTATSEQHKDLRSSTQATDMKDYSVSIQWLQAHPPFAGYQPDRLVSISTGVVADTSANCDNAVQIGHAAASKITGKKFTEITLHRSDKVKTMGDHSSISVRGQHTEMNSTLFFNRITCVLNTSSEMEQFMSYELAPQPPSLFHDGAMRKPAKSALVSSLATASTYEGVCQCYIAYILKHYYGAGTVTVFDGYRTASTKAAEQLRRAKKSTSSDILFDQNMKTTTTQAAFLANNHNNERLIEMLSGLLNEAGIQMKQAQADTDALIVSTALSLTASGKPVVVVGTDTDLLVMLVTLATVNMDLYMLCCKNPTTLYRVHDIQASIGDTSKYLMVLHAITGCDTVSALYRQGKRKAFSLVHKNKEYDLLNIFINAESTHQQVQEAGESFLLKLYGASSCASLDEFRYIAYNKAVSKM